MQNLNSIKARKKLATFITDFGHYSTMQEKSLGNLSRTMEEELSSTRKNMYLSEVNYYTWMRNHTEMQLARMGVFIHGDLSQDRLKEYDFNNYQEYQERLNSMKEARSKHQDWVKSDIEEVA